MPPIPNEQQMDTTFIWLIFFTLNINMFLSTYVVKHMFAQESSLQMLNHWMSEAESQAILRWTQAEH